MVSKDFLKHAQRHLGDFNREHYVLVNFVMQQIQQFQTQENFAMKHTLNGMNQTLEEIQSSILAKIPVEKRLAGLSAEERLEGLPVEKRLEGLSADERLKGLSLEELLKGLPLPEAELERLRALYLPKPN